MKPFWQTIPLAEMNPQQWESLCDGCGKCCLHKLEDEDTGLVYYTEVACKYLSENCRCQHYRQRQQKVEMCLRLRPEDMATVSWLPSTCAYRLLSEGESLPAWHPLVSGDPESVHRAGISVRGRVISETAVDPDDLEDYIVAWPA
jgi:uncharacterized cysteine cluster protein YcgN (CxxCxxCC family)